MPRLSPAVICAIGLIAATAGCLVGRDLTLIDAEPAVSNIEATPEGDGGATPGAPRKGDGGSSSSSSSSGGSSSGNPPPDDKKDAGVDANAPKPDAGGDIVVCSPLAKQEAEPNNVQQASNELTKGVNCGKLNIIGDEDWFTYDTGDAGGFLRLKFAAEGDAQIVVTSGGITFSGGSGSNFNFISQGRWYIRVYSPARQTSSYFLNREL